MEMIDRQAAIEVVEDAEMKWLKGEIDFIYPKVIKGLMSLPTIEERKKGRWVTYKVSPWGHEDIKCSVCGRRGCSSYWDFCPACGADMRGEENENQDN